MSNYICVNITLPTEGSLSGFWEIVRLPASGTFGGLLMHADVAAFLAAVVVCSEGSKDGHKEEPSTKGRLRTWDPLAFSNNYLCKLSCPKNPASDHAPPWPNCTVCTPFAPWCICITDHNFHPCSLAPSRICPIIHVSKATRFENPHDQAAQRRRLMARQDLLIQTWMLCTRKPYHQAVGVVSCGCMATIER